MAANRLLRVVSRCACRNLNLFQQQSPSNVIVGLRHCSTTGPPGGDALWKRYNRLKDESKDSPLPPDVDDAAVFVSNELDLCNISVYGFDYDYTLACYHESLHYLIYNLGREVLISKYKYPSAIGSLNYRSGFAVRGLHYDIQRGLLMKLDSFHQIQLGSVYRGLTPVSDDEVLAIYGQIALPKLYVEGPFFTGRNAPMQNLNDLFSIPEMSLLVNVQEYFEQNNIFYSAEILFWDVRNAVQSIHPVMHKIVEEHVEDYLMENRELRKYLEWLIKGGKQLFLITNSPYSFVERGLTYLVGSDWREMFDILIVRARKPNFFHETSKRPFRVYDTVLNSQTWESVTVLEKGKVYLEGTLKEFQMMTKWQGQEVLYFGDHVYSDLADLTLHHGWRTGAIIYELADEINIQNTDEYKKTIRWLEQLQRLIEDTQDYGDEESQAIIAEWEKERDSVSATSGQWVPPLSNQYEVPSIQKTKTLFNPQFGSLFRTHHNPTYFSRRLFRFADIYMSSVTNLLNYSLQHTFYPRRGVLPHEFRTPFI